MNCRICGADLPEGAMFCGECGSSTSATPESRRRADPRPGDTTVIERGLVRESGVISIPVEGFHAGAEPAGVVPGVSPEVTPAVADPLGAAASVADATELEGTVTPTASARGAEVGVEPAPADVDAEASRADAEVGDGADGSGARPWAPASPVGSDAAEGPDRTHARFVLRFTTGETRTVFGTGLIGRRPMPQPGESYDHLVQIADRSLSVSKTHLEFGEHDEQLWVADRFSANGTVVHRPDAGAVRCEPGRRYLVPRGSRVEIAEQSFRVE